jgi:hypothetical protein
LGWADGFGWTAEIAEDLACDEALEAADDLPLALALSRTALEVVKGGLVSAHAHDHHAMEGSVGLTMPAAVQPMPAGFVARGRHRAGAAELGEGSFGDSLFGLPPGASRPYWN